MFSVPMNRPGPNGVRLQQQQLYPLALTARTRQALKLGLHRKFSDHLALVREAMKIFLRSSVLLMVLVSTGRKTSLGGVPI